MFKPKTIRSGENLGVIDIAIRRPDFRQQPSELTSVHIDNTDAVISTGVIGIWNTFNEQFRIKNCLLAAIEYDGTWNMTVDEKYVFYTIGEPYIVYVNDKMELLIQQGQGTPTRLTNGHITSVSCVRGWKNIHDVGVDQGFVVAYVKNGNAYYKSYSEQDNGSKMWSAETQISELGDNLNSIRVTRSNDFRLIFTGTNSDNQCKLCVTERCFGGFSIRGEYISGYTEPIKVVTTPIEHIHTYANNEIIVGKTMSPAVSTIVGQPLTYLSIRNEGLQIIKLFVNTNMKYSNIYELRKYLTFTDENENTLFYSNIIIEDGCLTFEVLPMNDIVGDITLSHKSGNKVLLDMKNDEVKSFDVTFTPTDVLSDISPSAVICKSHNTNGKSITLQFDKKIQGNSDVLKYSFTITSKEEEYVLGPTYDTEYEVSEVIINDDSIELLFDDENSFDNVCQDINVYYHMGRGDLTDEKGKRVRSQCISFVPTNLNPKPNPNVVDNIITGHTEVVSVSITHINEIHQQDDGHIIIGKTKPIEITIQEVGQIRP